ncbi:hypothetical protein MMC13_004192 [Lambiella insularis]|nr:hypothetical protein [Lambiella insularis]
MTLCSNRPEGFGPLSHLFSDILTPCFLDTILIPLCTWLYLLTVLLLLFLSRRRNIPNVSDRKYKSSATVTAYNEQTYEDGYEPSSVTPLHKHGKGQIALLVLYTLLIIAEVLMCILEMVRLGLASLGIGLLPFTPVAIIVAGTLHLGSTLSRGRRILGGKRGWTRWINLALWTALIAVSGVKLAEEVKEGVNSRKGSKYPMADEVTDMGVMVGVYVALAILEMFEYFVDRRYIELCKLHTIPGSSLQVNRLSSQSLNKTLFLWFDSTFSRIRKYLHSRPSSTSAKASSSERAIFEPVGPFPLLALPIEIRLKIHGYLLVPYPGIIVLVQAWNHTKWPRLRFNQQGEYVETAILLANRQISAEASGVTYSQAVLHLRCDESLRMPFPQDPFRGIGPLMSYPNKDGDKLSAVVLRRFKTVRLTFLVSALHDSHPDSRDIQYFGYNSGYTPGEMLQSINAFKDVLEALAISKPNYDAEGTPAVKAYI